MRHKTRHGINRIKQRESEFFSLANSCERDELVQCMKFLAMYIALYRQNFGDIPAASLAKLVEPIELDEELLDIIDDGMLEASEMLKIILLRRTSTPASNRHSLKPN